MTNSLRNYKFDGIVLPNVFFCFLQRFKNIHIEILKNA
jgi:hypothetical protein